MSSNEIRDLNNIYLEAVYGGEKKEEPKDDRMVVTAADKKGNTPAYQKYKAGAKNVKTGKPLYKAADHLKDDKDWGYDKKGNSLNPVDIEKRKKKDDDLAGSPKNEELQNIRSLVEKKKDTPDQVKAVIAFDKARKGTDDATYDSEHGDKEQAKKERDYAKWQRDKGAEDAQKSGHPWEHAKGSTREKEGKKSEKHAHIKDDYQPLYSKQIQGYSDAYKSIYETWGGEPTDTQGKGVVKKELKALKKGALTGKGKDVAKADKIADEFVPSQNIAKLAESGQFSVDELWKIVEVEEGYQRNPEKGEAEDRKAERDRKASGRMPPRGDKRREDFEKWYAANVR